MIRCSGGAESVVLRRPVPARTEHRHAHPRRRHRLHPRRRAYVHQHTKDWSARVEAADAFAFVAPKYNHGLAAPLKNALDYLHHEWAYKPAGLVSYGGVSAGLRGADMLAPVLAALRVVPIAAAVSVPFFTQFIGEDGVFRPNEELRTGIDAMLTELAEVEAALRQLR